MGLPFLCSASAAMPLQLWKMIFLAGRNSLIWWRYSRLGLIAAQSHYRNECLPKLLVARSFGIS